MRRGSAILIGFFLACLRVAADDLSPTEMVVDLYNRGEYADCRGLAARMIDDYAAGAIKVPVAEIANVYLVAACLADVYRDADYAEAVDDILLIALEMDPNVDPSIVESRPFVKNRLSALRSELLTSQGLTGRRFSIAAVFDVEGPGGIHWRNTPMFGIRLGAGILPWLAVEAGVSLPVQDPPVDEGELWLGAAFRPAFRLNRPMLMLNADYVATRQGSWSHGLSLGAGAEIVLRSGVSFRVTAELLRMDGTEPPDPDQSDYPFITLFGAPIVLSLPGISLSVAYSF